MANETVPSPEALITMAQAMQGLPGAPSPATGARWAKRGLTGPHGERIRLQAWTCGRLLCTTREAVQDFIAAVTAARSQASDAGPMGATSAQLREAGLV